MNLDAKNRQVIKGQVKTDVKITRMISGITLAVNCYLSQGTYVGSCVYNDLCDLLKSVLSLDENNCPQNLIDNGIPCKCPFDLPIRDLNINQSFQLPNLSNSTILSSTPNSNPWLFLGYWLSSGDFDVTIKSTIGTTNILCLNMKFSTKPI